MNIQLFLKKDQNKKEAANILRAVTKYNASLAQTVVDAGALENLVECIGINFIITKFFLSF